MKNFIQTLRNIFKIDDLRARIVNTLLFLLIYRLAAHVVLPGVDPTQLAGLKNQTAGGILGLLDMFAGGAFSQASVVALGIMPYISASIVVQLLGIAVPYFQKLQKEGESGRKKLNQFTRILTVIVVVFQAPGYLINLKSQAPGAIIAYTNPEVISPAFFMISSTLIIVAGTLFIMWLGERITEKGIGNGISLIIMTGIIARLPFALRDEFLSRLNEGGGLVLFLIEIVALFAVVVSVILLVQGTRKIPVQFAKKIVGNKQYGGVRQYIPLKVNAAGVMPIVFAQAIMFIPAYVAQFFPASSTWQGFASSLTDFHSFWYNFIFATLIILFTYFYTAISVNPSQMADDMKKNGGFIPGVKPGRKTAEFIDDVMSKITLPGSFFLAFVAIMPTFAKIAGVNTNFAQFYGGTSLLILVGVVLDTLQQIESHLLMRHYDGLMNPAESKAAQQQALPYNLLCSGKMSSGVVVFKTPEEIESIRKSSLLVGKTLAEVANHIREGITTLELDIVAEKFIRDHGAEPSFKGYNGYKNCLCISINEEIVHGIPGSRVIKDGDVVSVDCGVFMNGFHGDSAYTFPIGEVNAEKLKLLYVTKSSLYRGIEKARSGNRVGDLSNAVQAYAESHGYGVVRELVGHGIGRRLHEKPEVPNYGKKGSGQVMKKGMTIAIEPMINLGSRQVIQLKDGWTVITHDRKISAHYEHTVSIGDEKADILSSFEEIEIAISKNKNITEIIETLI